MYTARVFFKSTKKSKLKVLRKVNSIFLSTYVPFRILVNFRNCQEKFADYRALRVQRVLFTNVLANNNNNPRPEHTLQLVNTCNAFYVWIEHIDHSLLVFFNCIFYITDVLMYFFIHICTYFQNQPFYQQVNLEVGHNTIPSCTRTPTFKWSWNSKIYSLWYVINWLLEVQNHNEHFSFVSNFDLFCSIIS